MSREVPMVRSRPRSLRLVAFLATVPILVARAGDTVACGYLGQVDPNVCADTALVELDHRLGARIEDRFAGGIDELGVLRVLEADSLPSSLRAARDARFVERASLGDSIAQVWLFARTLVEGSFRDSLFRKAPNALARRLLGHKLFWEGRYQEAWDLFGNGDLPMRLAYERAWIDMALHWPEHRQRGLAYDRAKWPDLGALACLDAFRSGAAVPDSFGICGALGRPERFDAEDNLPSPWYGFMRSSRPLVDGDQRVLSMISCWKMFRSVDLREKPEEGLHWLRAAAFFGHRTARRCLESGDLEPCREARRAGSGNAFRQVLTSEGPGIDPARWQELLRGLDVRPVKNDWGFDRDECAKSVACGMRLFLLGD